jgi:hypothetical protein
MWPELQPRPVRARFLPWLLLATIGATVLWAVPSLPRPKVVAAAIVGMAGTDLQELLQPKPKRKPARKPSTRPRPARRTGGLDGSIPARARAAYLHTGHGERWRVKGGGRYLAAAVLAGIGQVESGHGQSRAPGVRSGLNFARCCAGPMQFNLTDGPPSTWDTFGRGSVYDLEDAVAAAGRKLRAQGARTDLWRALLAYNRDSSYVARVLALARRYQH